MCEPCRQRGIVGRGTSGCPIGFGPELPLITFPRGAASLLIPANGQGPLVAALRSANFKLWTVETADATAGKRTFPVGGDVPGKLF